MMSLERKTPVNPQLLLLTAIKSQLSSQTCKEPQGFLLEHLTRVDFTPLANAGYFCSSSI